MLDRFERFTSFISSLNRFVQKIERDEMEKFGLKGAFAQYLLAMDRYPEGITAAMLCEVCDRDKAAVSRILTELEQKGMVCRADPGDRPYRAKMTLTPAGKQAAAFVRRRATLAVDLVGKGLTDEHREVLYETLHLISTNIETICQTGLPDGDNE